MIESGETRIVRSCRSHMARISFLRKLCWVILFPTLYAWGVMVLLLLSLRQNRTKPWKGKRSLFKALRRLLTQSERNASSKLVSLHAGGIVDSPALVEPTLNSLQ